MADTIRSISDKAAKGDDLKALETQGQRAVDSLKAVKEKLYFLRYAIEDDAAYTAADVAEINGVLGSLGNQINGILSDPPPAKS
jgi:hypothetical protein